MDIQIKGKNLEVPDDLHEYTERKVAKLTKLAKRMNLVDVEFTEIASKKRSKSRRVEVVAHVPGLTMRSEEENQTFFIALDSAIDKLKRQLKKLKTKRLDKTREHPGIAKVVNSGLQEEDRSETRNVIIKRFTLKPMSVDEAIMQLDLSGYDFFLFVSHDDSINCVYKRSDGGIGLLVPETASIE